MLKVEHPIDYLKEENTSLEAAEPLEGAQHVKQIASRQKTLRFKRSDDNPELPENFKVGQAIGAGDCFFDSVAQGLKQLKPDMGFTVKSLRKVCKDLAIGDQQLKSRIVKDAKNCHDPTTVVPDSSVSDDELWDAYLASIVLNIQVMIYEGWNFNSGNYLFTTDTKWIHVSKFYCPSM